MWMRRAVSAYVRPVVRDINVRKRSSATSVKVEEIAYPKSFSEIPRDFTLPLIGTYWQNLPFIGRYKPGKNLENNQDKRKRLGNFFVEKYFSNYVVVSFSREDLEKVYRAEGVYPFRDFMLSVKLYRESKNQSIGLLNLYGKEWYDLRSKTQTHLLKPTEVAENLVPMQEIARDFVSNIGKMTTLNGEVPDLLHEIGKWALESVSFVGLDARLGCLQIGLPEDSDAVRMVTSVNTMFECMAKLEPSTGNLPIFKYISTPTWRRFKKASDVYFDISCKYIEKAMQACQKTLKSPNKKLTMLQSMLVNKDLDPEEAVLFVADMIAGGLETTSSTVGFLLYHLARNPEKQELLYEEVMNLLPHEGAKVNPTIYGSMKYAKASLKESMRLLPTVPGNARVLAKDAVLSGYHIPANTIVVVFNDLCFRDPSIYPNPNEFQPERWLDRSKRRPGFAFLPFGFGVRSCIGRRLAEMEIVLLVAEILRKYRVEYHLEDIGLETRLVNVPDRPLHFNFIRR